jgi:hypothetical protein
MAIDLGTPKRPMQGLLAELPVLPDDTLEQGQVYQCTDQAQLFYLAIVGGVQVWLASSGSPQQVTTKVVPFSFTNAPKIALDFVVEQTVAIRAAIQILVEFDGVGAELVFQKQLGPIILNSDENVPSMFGQYEKDEMVVMGNAGQLELLITPGTGATQGIGILLYELAEVI